jgi:hypothetical protein
VSAAAEEVAEAAMAAEVAEAVVTEAAAGEMVEDLAAVAVEARTRTAGLLSPRLFPISRARCSAICPC